jgi:hypothetical protein
MAALWFPRIRRMAQTASTGRWNGITILRLEPMAALWFPRIGRMAQTASTGIWNGIMILRLEPMASPLVSQDRSHGNSHHQSGMVLWRLPHSIFGRICEATSCDRRHHSSWLNNTDLSTVVKSVKYFWCYFASVIFMKKLTERWINGVHNFPSWPISSLQRLDPICGHERMKQVFPVTLLYIRYMGKSVSMLISARWHE